MSTAILDQVRAKKIIAIVRGVPSRNILDVARALLEGGVSMMEVTFDHSSREGLRETRQSLELLSGEMRGKIALGAGTVLTPEEAETACDCGAEYIISPNVDERVIARTGELELVSMPGAFTPTEIVQAHNAGADIVKVFPAGDLGTGYLKSLRGPLPHIPLAAVGGVTPENIGDFFDAGAIAVGVGSNLVNAKKAAAGEYASITAAARAFTASLK